MRRTTPERERGVAGAPRMDGSSGLVFLAHIVAGNPDWQNRYANRSSPLWEVCGFEQVPSWQTTWRDRYAVAGTSQATRSKRRGYIAAQNLRAATALLAEWSRVCLRQGCIGNLPKRNTAQPGRRTGGAKRLIRLREYRQTKASTGVPPVRWTRGN